jgi:hypothetical protein
MFPRPCDDWGYEVRMGGLPPMPPDTQSVRLYRGAKGADFRPVEEAFLTGPADTTWDMHEEFRTRVSQRLEYRLRALDRDANIGPVADPAIPAYLQGTAPPPRPTIVRSLLEADGDWLVRWHAPGAEALVGFLLRVGKADNRFSALLFEILPENNALSSEATVGVDVDFDGIPSPYRIITRNATKILADKADMGVLMTRDPVDGSFERTFSGLVLEDDTVVEIYAIDATGVLSEPAMAAPVPFNFTVLDALEWPERPAPPAFHLAAAFVDAPTAYVALCWDNGEPFPDGIGGHPRHVAIFRTAVEPDRPDSYQQRSPRIDIVAYDAGGVAPGDELDCNDCKDELEDLPGFPDPVRSLVCWRDYGTPGSGMAPGTYRYTVLGFSDPPPVVDPEGPPVTRDPSKRNEGEIDAVYGSPPAAAEVVVP